MTSYLSYADAATVARHVRILNPLAASDIDECDRGKLESALAAPQAGFGDYEKYESLAQKAGALLYAVAKAHGCPNGNKRLAYVLTVAFLMRNEFMLWADPDEVREKVEEITATDAKDADAVREALGEWFATRLVADVEAHVRLQAGQKLGG